jgi:hypothetical protein
MNRLSTLLLCLLLASQCANATTPQGLWNPLHKLHTECSLSNLLACFEFSEHPRE